MLYILDVHLIRETRIPVIRFFILVQMMENIKAARV